MKRKKRYSRLESRLARCESDAERQEVLLKHQEWQNEAKISVYSRELYVEMKRLVLQPRTKNTEQAFDRERSTALKHALKALIFELDLRNKPLMVPVFRLKAKRLIKEEFPEYLGRLIP